MQLSATEEIYNPQINPNDFVSKINNKYLHLVLEQNLPTKVRLRRVLNELRSMLPTKQKK